MDHISEYNDWAKNDISYREHNKNIAFIEKRGVPNIFIGYKNKDGHYVNSSFDMIQELFFGKEHDHEKYKSISFWRPKITSGDRIFRNYKELKTYIDNLNSSNHCIPELHPGVGHSVGGYKNKFLKYNIKINQIAKNICAESNYF
jgi:hypothetical protein